MKLEEVVQACLLMGDTPEALGREAFAAHPKGWEFETATDRSVAVVATPDGEAFVGLADEDGILWAAGTAFVVDGGNEDVAARRAIRWTAGCVATTRVTRKFRVARGFEMTPVLVAL